MTHHSMGNSPARRIRARLPHDLVRGYRRRMAPQAFAKLQALRDVPVTGEDTVSVAPFVTRGAVFVHIPKCAGLAISHAVFGCRGGAHMPIETYKILFSKKEFDSFFKFTFVRNPWDRLVSAYFFIQKGGLGANAARLAEETLSRYDGFDDFVRGYVAAGEVWNVNFFRPQAAYLCVSDRAPPEVDFIGRFERIEQDFEMVRKRLNLTTSIARRNANATRPRDYRPLYSPETVDIVARVYARDIALFGYSFE